MDDRSPRLRIVRLIRMLLDAPYRYTKKELAKKVGMTPGTINGDFEVLRNGGLDLKYDKDNYRYALVLDRSYEQLKDLLHFTDDDRLFLKDAIDHYDRNGKRAGRVKQKLSSIYDYYRLGHPYLRKTHLDKLNLLEKAKKEERRVVLKDYRSSNSNSVRDRLVEPFHLSYDEDVLHAFDVELGKVRHYRILRIKRIAPLDEGWAFKGKHVVLKTDPFRISNNRQLDVSLRLEVGAYNDLLERFPACKPYITPDASEADVFHLQCKVNEKFLGLSNFILGYHQAVEVQEPESLKEHLLAQLREMERRLGEG